MEIRARREALGLTQEQLAFKAGCSTSLLRIYEKGWQSDHPKAGQKIEKTLQRLEKGKTPA